MVCLVYIIDIRLLDCTLQEYNCNITTLCHWFLHVPQRVCTPAFAGAPDIGIVEEICEVCRHISLQNSQ